MAEVFRCPSCSGRLEFDGGDHATVRCDYCGSTVIVPESLRPRTRSTTVLFNQHDAVQEVVRLINAGNRAEATQLFAKTFGVTQQQAQEAVDRLAAGLSVSTQHVDVQRMAHDSTRAVRRLGCLVAVIVTVVALGVVIVPLFLGGAAAWSIFSQEPVATSIAEVLDDGLPATLAFSTEQPTDYASLLEIIGSEGIALGQFVDPRAIAVAPEGEIFIADYSNGRVQRFDAQGIARSVWQWDRERVVQSLGIGTDGHLYAIQAGNLLRFDRETGELLAELTYESPRRIVSFSDLAVAPNGDVVALNHFGEFVRFDASGNVLQIVDIEETANIRRARKLTVDGVGNVYLLGTYEDALGKRHNGVFLFDTDGRYLSRFGSDGDEAGQFRSPNTIAVDGQGRIHVSDFGGILTFSNSGTFLGVTDPEGVIFGIAFNSQSEMWAVGNANRLFRYTLPAARQ